MRGFSLGLAVVFLLLGSLQTCDGAVVFFKQIQDESLCIHRPFPVSMLLYNHRDEALYSVLLNDTANWPKVLFTLNEPAEVTVEAIPAGGTFNYTFIVVPNFDKIHILPSSAVATFAVENNPKKRVLSNTVPPFPVLSAREYDLATSTRRFEWMMFVFVACIPTVAPAFAYIYLRRRRHQRLAQMKKMKTQ